jgi:hypothetical protein
MTNDERKPNSTMTKQTKGSESLTLNIKEPLGHSAFVILWSFVIGNWSLNRLALRQSGGIAKMPGVQRDQC